MTDNLSASEKKIQSLYLIFNQFNVFTSYPTRAWSVWKIIVTTAKEVVFLACFVCLTTGLGQQNWPNKETWCWSGELVKGEPITIGSLKDHVNAALVLAAYCTLWVLFNMYVCLLCSLEILNVQFSQRTKRKHYFSLTFRCFLVPSAPIKMCSVNISR